MAYTLEEFVKLGPSQRSTFDRAVACTKCATELHENVSGYRLTSDGPYCSDCYFDALSEALETHPVGAPGLRR